MNHLRFLSKITPSAFLDIQCVCVCCKLTCGWKSGGEGLRNFSFRAPTGSSSFLFSTLLDQQQGRGLRTKVRGIYSLQPHTKQPLHFSMCSHKSPDVTHVAIAVSGLIGAEIPVYGVHEEC